MKLSPLFKWFGSKWQTAKHYPNPEHEYIIEPFAGGAGYSLNHSERIVIIWDEDPNVAELWKWLINTAAADPSLILDIPINLPVGKDIRTLDLERGQELLLKHWQRTNNVGECWTISPWGNSPGQWTANTRSRVADEVGGVAHWEFRDPQHYINTAATWFIDPPYQYNYRYRASLERFEHSRLDSFAQTVSADSLLIFCEAVGKKGEVPSYLPFQPSHRAVTSRRKLSESHHSRELIYIRRPRSSAREGLTF